MRTDEEHGLGHITTEVAQNAAASVAVLTAATVGLDPHCVHCAVLSIAQQFHVTQCFGGMSHCNLFCTLTLYFMLSHVLDFGGTL